MKKFLVGLPIILLLMYILILPGVIWGKIGYTICKIILAIVSTGITAFVIGDIILNK